MQIPKQGIRILLQVQRELLEGFKSRITRSVSCSEKIILAAVWRTGLEGTGRPVGRLMEQPRERWKVAFIRGAVMVERSGGIFWRH